MGKARWICLTLLLALFGGATFIWHSRPAPEPRYKGLPLSFWLKGYGSHPPWQFRQQFLPRWLRAYAAKTQPPTNKNVIPTSYEAHEAVEQIGTNAIPTLLSMLVERDSWFRSALLVFARQEFTPAVFKQAAAREALLGMIPPATNAVLALIQMHNKNPAVIFDVLAQMGPSAIQAVPMLAQEARRTSSAQIGAIEALGEIRSIPTVSVPALIEALHDEDYRTRAQAAMALAQFGTAARPAVPALLELLQRERAASPANPTNSWLLAGKRIERGAPWAGLPSVSPISNAWPASYALFRIDPEAASNANIKSPPLLGP